MKINMSENYKFRGTALNWLIGKYENCERVNLDDTILFKDSDGKIVFSYDKESKRLEVSKKRIWNVFANRIGMDRIDVIMIIRAFAIDYLNLKDLKYKGNVVPTTKFDDETSEKPLETMSENKDRVGYNFIISESKLYGIFDNFLDKIESKLKRREVKFDDGDKGIVWEYPDQYEFDVSIFDYEQKVDSSDEPIYYFWVREDLIEELMDTFSLSKKKLEKMIKKWAQKKFHIKIDDVKFQGK